MKTIIMLAILLGSVSQAATITVCTEEGYCETIEVDVGEDEVIDSIDHTLI
jgi:hypothetical protein